MPRQILVVDDDESVRAMLVRLLESHGFEAAPAGNAAEARRLVARGSFDLLIVDVVMPGESGLALAGFLRGSPAPPPIILISGYATDEPAMFAAEHPDVHFMPKPFGADSLLSLVETMLPD